MTANPGGGDYRPDARETGMAQGCKFTDDSTFCRTHARFAPCHASEMGTYPARETDARGITNLEGELAQLRAEVERLTHLLGSHADGHRCTCTLVKDAVYHGDNMAPAEWDQNPWCPTHPDVGMIHERLFNLAEDWQGAADADDTHPREARTMAVLAKELHAVLRGDPLTLDGPVTSATSPSPASTGDTGTPGGSAPSDSPSEAQSAPFDCLTERARGRCDSCGRCTWDDDLVGQACLMTQPNGSQCRGIFHESTDGA